MPETQETLKKIRCKRCGKPLVFANIREGKVSLDCTNSQCRHRNLFEFKNGEMINDERRKQVCRLHAECKREGTSCNIVR